MNIAIIAELNTLLRWSLLYDRENVNLTRHWLDLRGKKIRLCLSLLPHCFILTRVWLGWLEKKSEGELPHMVEDWSERRSAGQWQDEEHPLRFHLHNWLVIYIAHNFTPYTPPPAFFLEALNRGIRKETRLSWLSISAIYNEHICGADAVAVAGLLKWHACNPWTACIHICAINGLAIRRWFPFYQMWGKLGRWLFLGQLVNSTKSKYMDDIIK